MQIFSGKAALAMAALGYSQIAGMVGLAAALVTMFKPQWSAVTGTVFSVCKGIALAGLTGGGVTTVETYGVYISLRRHQQLAVEGWPPMPLRGT